MLSTPAFIIPLPRRIFELALLLALAFVLGGCGSKNLGYTPSGSAKGSDIVKTAYSQMGQRYRNGGDSPNKGFDCSGLIWWTYKKHGIKVPRITTDQAHTGKSVPRGQAKLGDIVVFRTGSSPRGLHTGIYSGNGTFIHSPRRGERVRMESMEIPYWDKKFVGVRRVVY
ncbi:MAG: C40 family peptidase [Desulfovibrionaceae bacterium]